LALPPFASRAFSAAICFSNSYAGSSFESCGTSFPAQPSREIVSTTATDAGEAMPIAAE
jgi:hypothetical protein